MPIIAEIGYWYFKVFLRLALGLFSYTLIGITTHL